MKLDLRTVMLLHHPNREEVLLLKRDANKRLFPNLMTGIGGKVELDRGEGDDLEMAMWREFEEETNIDRRSVIDTRLQLTTTLVRDNMIVTLLWFIGHLITIPKDLSCTEGTLIFIDRHDLPKTKMVPTAYQAISFMLSLPDDDQTQYVGCFSQETSLTVVPKTK